MVMNFTAPAALEIPYKKRSEKVVVIGSGPAGFFAAHVLQLAGFQVTIIERGSEVEQRSQGHRHFGKQGRIQRSE